MRASRDFPRNAAADRARARAQLAGQMSKTTIRFDELRFDVPQESHWYSMAAVARFEQRCFWCGMKVKRGQDGVVRGTDATRDHIVPKCYGGRGAANLVVACRRCNNARGNDVFWQPHPSVASSYALRALDKLRDEARRKLTEANA